CRLGQVAPKPPAAIDPAPGRGTDNRRRRTAPRVSRRGSPPRPRAPGGPPGPRARRRSRSRHGGGITKRRGLHLAGSLQDFECLAVARLQLEQALGGTARLGQGVGVNRHLSEPEPSERVLRTLLQEAIVDLLRQRILLAHGLGQGPFLKY